MNKKITLSILFASILAGVLFINNKKSNSVDDEPQIAKPGMVAYAASYSSDASDEPNYLTQKNKTFKYLNLRTTLDYYRGDSVKVGIIDSGINYDHEDFMVDNQTKVKGDSKYYSYQTSSWVYYKASQHGYSYIDDTLGHGTNVAATVAAAINSIGGTGLAPNVELYVYKVTNSNNGYEFGAIQNALLDAKALGLDVINMSFQSYEHAVSYNGSSMAASSGCSSILTTYLNQAYNAGITLVGAAGNYNTDEPSYPGSNSHVINVGSLNSTGDGKAGFSNYGSTIDLVAPGYVYVADEANNSAYTNTQGTSFSAPLVTAAIALYIQKNPSATPAQIEQALYDSCDPIDSGSTYSNWAGHGALNVAEFLDIHDGYPTDISLNNITNNELALEVDDTFSLDWTVNGVGDFSDEVEIECFDQAVSVDQEGHITAIAEGTDIISITSKSDSSVTTYIEVTVSASTTPSNKLVVGKNGAFWKDNLKTTSATRGNVTYTAFGNGSHDGKYYSSDKTWRFYTSGSSGFKVTAPSGCGITSVVLEWKNNKFTTPTNTTADVTTSPTTYTTNSPFVNELDFKCSSNCSSLVSATVTYATYPTLSSISIKTASTKTEYDSGDTFDPTGLVITRNYIGGYSDDYEYEGHASDFTFNPSTSTALTTDDDTVTITYGGQSCNLLITVNKALEPETLTITRSSFSSNSGYAWYDWTATTTDSTSISGKGELYTTTETSMQFNKSKGDKVAALYNTTAIPGSITKIEATTASGTNRKWNAYVTSTACSSSGATLTFGDNKTTIGSSVTISTSSTTIGTSTSGYSYFCVQEYDSSVSYLSEIKITYTPKSISSIAVKTEPTKTTYEAGEYFDPTGLVITATYSDSSTNDIAYSSTTSSLFTFTPSISTALTTDDTSVTITYSEKTCSQAISVGASITLSSISVSGQTTSFVEGDEFVFGGTVTAHFSDSSSSNVTTSATFTGYTMTTLGNQTVTASYTYKGKTETANYTINVGKGTPSSLSVSGQTMEYVKNASFSFDGTCTVTFNNGYQKVVTPTSVTSPDMSVAGNKTITVSYTYNEATVSTTYIISVNAYRTVMEEVTTTTTIGSAIYTSGSEVLSTGVTRANTSGTVAVESNALKLGSGSKGGTATISSQSAFNRVVISAKKYGSDSDVTISLGELSCNLTSNYQEFTQTFDTPQTSVSISTPSKDKRALVQTIYLYLDTTTETDIGHSEDCVGLETFINTYMHMDYTESLGYCNDSTHHYYSTAKAAFNNLNDHQRALFTTNSAYSVEYARLVAWASFNGDSLNSTSNKFVHFKDVQLLNFENKTDGILIMVAISTLLVLAGYLFIKKKKEN